MNRLRYVKYFIKNAWFVLLYKLFKRKRSCKRFNGKKGITMDYSDDVLFEYLKSDKPFMAVRYGATELSCINNWEKINLGYKKSYKNRVIYSMKNNAGFFPCDDKSLNQYAELMDLVMRDADIVGIMAQHMEDYFVNKQCPKANIIQYMAFEPINKKWLETLNGKKVLVVSPFKKDILAQLQKREHINAIKKLNTEFCVVEAVQSIGNANTTFHNWFDALEYMKSEIAKQDFDVALIGAGAYGTPLCHYVKSLGKQAIQTGGATSLLFGIIGRRWEKRDYVLRELNEYWIHPSEKPEGYENVEKGCYW